MTHDPRPGTEDGGAPAVPGWLSVRDVALAVGIGLVLAAVLLALTPGSLAHVLGGTDRRQTTVTEVTEGFVTDDRDRPVTTYDLRWTDGEEARTATLRRSGAPERAVGDTWTLWVSPDGSSVETSSPLATGLGLAIGMPVLVLLVALVVRWRGRVVARSAVREAERIEKAQARRRRPTEGI